MLCVSAVFIVAAIPVLTVGAAVTAAIAVTFRTSQLAHGPHQSSIRTQMRFFWRRWWQERWRALPLSLLALSPLLPGLVGRRWLLWGSRSPLEAIVGLGLLAVVTLWVLRAGSLLASYPFLAGSTAVRNAAYRLWERPRQTVGALGVIWVVLSVAIVVHPLLIPFVLGALSVWEGIMYGTRVD